MVRPLLIALGACLPLALLLATASASPPAPPALGPAAQATPVSASCPGGSGEPPAAGGPPRAAASAPRRASPSADVVQAEWVSQVPAEAPADNPLKGFVPYPGTYAPPRGSGFPHSMENLYVPLCAVMTGPGTFAWAPFETQLDAIAGRGNQTIVRYYVDHPNRPPGVPRFLVDSGLRCTPYSDHGNNDQSCAPNYEDPSLRRALQDFIRAYGERYDGDARIAFIQIGLLGFWGEWHTFPHTAWFASPAVQDEVLQAHTSAFRTTRLLVRYPQPNNVALGVGYHDDSFVYTTICPLAFCFVSQLQATGATEKWRTQPIGGEIRPSDPDLQVCLWDSPPCPNAPDRGGNPVDYAASVQTTHASWLWNQAIFSRRNPAFTAEGPQYARALEGARQLGYTLFVSAVSLPNVDATGTFQVAIRLQNTGVAPFYYNWPVELGVLDAAGQLARTWSTDWDLSRVLPGEPPTQLGFAEPNTGLPAGRYTAVLRVVNPLAAPPYSVAAARPLRFANQAQDQDLAGWLTLGSFTASRDEGAGATTAWREEGLAY